VRRALVTAAATAAAVLAAPAAAQAEQVISMPGKFFDPARVSVLAGEPVSWRNTDLIEHDVAAADLFQTGRMDSGVQFDFAFSAPGEYDFRCTIHSFMAGHVSVAAVLLDAPDGPVLAGESLQLTGRAAAGTAQVRIERSLDSVSWADTGVAATPAADGAYSVMLPAVEGAAYRAAVPAGTSAVVMPQVAARVPVALHVARGHHRARVHVRTAPAGAGLLATLETYRRERFDWRAVGRPVRLDRAGRATFSVPAGLRARARVVLTAKRGGNPLITSTPVRLSDGRPTKSPIPLKPQPGGGHGGPAAPAGPATPGGEHEGDHPAP
jgi:plastocyanin